MLKCAQVTLRVWRLQVGCRRCRRQMIVLSLERPDWIPCELRNWSLFGTELCPDCARKRIVKEYNVDRKDALKRAEGKP